MNKYEELIYSLIYNCNRELTDEERQILNQASAIYNTYNQLTEQLGCPLEVLFKLINQNELYYQFYNELQHWTSVKVDLRKKVVWYCKQVGGHYACSQPLSNYGKTFWLRKDRSE